MAKIIGPGSCNVDLTGFATRLHSAGETTIGEGMDIETALKFANCTAALSVTKLGAAESMPSRPEINEFMRKIYNI